MKMKKFISIAFVASLLVVVAPSASADWKDWLRDRVPGVKVRIPNPMSRAGKPAVDVRADGHGVRSAGNAGGNIVVANAGNSNSSTNPNTNTATAKTTGGNGGRSGVIIIPPNASREAPNFRGVTVTVDWFGIPMQPVRLVGNIQKELGKRGASFAYRNDDGGPCNIGQPVVCFVVGRPVAVSSGSGRGSNSSSRPRGSNSGSSSESYGGYIVTVQAFLVRGDGSAPVLLAERSEGFTVTSRQYESWSHYSSRSGRRSSSSGSSSYSLKNGELAILSEAARQAEGEIKHLLKEKSRKDWTPGAAELVTEAFRR